MFAFSIELRNYLENQLNHFDDTIARLRIFFRQISFGKGDHLLCFSEFARASSRLNDHRWERSKKRNERRISLELLDPSHQSQLLSHRNPPITKHFSTIYLHSTSHPLEPTATNEFNVSSSTCPPPFTFKGTSSRDFASSCKRKSMRSHRNQMSCSTNRHRRSKTYKILPDWTGERRTDQTHVFGTSNSEETSVNLNIIRNDLTRRIDRWTNIYSIQRRSYCSFRCFTAHSQRVRICSGLNFSNDWIFSVVVPVTLCKSIFMFVPFIKSNRMWFNPCSNGNKRMLIHEVKPWVRLISNSFVAIWNRNESRSIDWKRRFRSGSGGHFHRPSS